MHIEVAVTAMVFNAEGLVLITKRSPNKKRFPGFWTVPGGHFEHKDIALAAEKKATNEHGVTYGVLEAVVFREVLEETGLMLNSESIQYCENMALDSSDPNKCVIVLAMAAELLVEDQKVKLNDEATDYAWIGRDQIKDYVLIEGIQEELNAAFDLYWIDRVTKEALCKTYS